MRKIQMSCGRNPNPTVSVLSGEPGQRGSELAVASHTSLHRLCLGLNWRRVGMACCNSAHKSDSVTTPGPEEASHESPKSQVSQVPDVKDSLRWSLSSQKPPKQAAMSKLATRNWLVASLGLDAQAWVGWARETSSPGACESSSFPSRCYTKCEHR